MACYYQRLNQILDTEAALAHDAVRVSAPCSTVCPPLLPVRSVLVKPGSTALTRMFGNALAYYTVSMLTAVFDAG